MNELSDSTLDIDTQVLGLQIKVDLCGVHELGNFDFKNNARLVRSLIVSPLVFGLVCLSHLAVSAIHRHTTPRPARDRPSWKCRGLQALLRRAVSHLIDRDDRHLETDHVLDRFALALCVISRLRPQRGYAWHRSYRRARLGDSRAV